MSRAFLQAIDQFESMKDQAYNVGLSDANLSKLELCAQIRKQVPRFVFLEAPIGEDPDKRDYVVSNAKIEAAGFRPSLHAGRWDSRTDQGLHDFAKRPLRKRVMRSA